MTSTAPSQRRGRPRAAQAASLSSPAARAASARRSATAWPRRAPRSPPATAATTSRRGVPGRALRTRAWHHPPGQRRLGGGLPAHRQRGHRPARAAGHPRQQRRHHHRQDGPEDELRGLVQGPRRQPLRRLLHGQGGAATHGRARHRPDREHLLDHRPAGQHRPGELRRVEVRPVRPDDDPRPRGRPRAQEGRQARGQRARPHRQHRRARASSRPTCSRPCPRRCSTASAAKIPLGRLGQPDEIARVVHFLADDALATSPGRSGASTAGMDM